METTRYILFIALFLVLTMIWQAWQLDYGSLSPPNAPLNSSQNDAKNDTKTPDETLIDKPVLPTVVVSDPLATKTEETPQLNIEGISKTPTIIVETDVYNLKIDLQGGTITQLELKHYPLVKTAPENLVALLYNRAADNFYTLQSGLSAADELPAPNHRSRYQAEQFHYELGDQDTLTVPLTWQSEDGLAITKVFTFHRGQYLVTMSHEVNNNTLNTWRGRAYAQLHRTDNEDGVGFIYTYTGGVLSSPDDRYQKIKFSHMADNDIASEIKNGWIAMLQHYFVAVLIPQSTQQSYHYYTLSPQKQSYAVGFATPPQDVLVGEQATIEHRLYIGPKLQKELAQIADGLELTVDYGILWFIAKILYWILDFIYQYVQNWGWSIILLTVFIKLVFYQLSAVGYRSMARMRKFQPRLLEMRERYKEDRAKLSQVMMDFYKTEKINPFGGCFPILVQIPVFIALYWVLLESVELRQASFALWITDLSAPDPYYVLPIIMGFTMFVQQKLNPAPLDPIQERVFAFLPLFFTIFFLFFPSGLVLYWVVNNTLSIIQQWFIMRNID